MQTQREKIIGCDQAPPIDIHIHYPIAVGLPATVPNSTSEFPVNLSESLYCACGFVTRKLEKTRRNAGLFSDFFPAVFSSYVVQTTSKSVQKTIKNR